MMRSLSTLLRTEVSAFSALNASRTKQLRNHRNEEANRCAEPMPWAYLNLLSLLEPARAISDTELLHAVSASTRIPALSHGA
jgi:hypothetical protein